MCFPGGWEFPQMHLGLLNIQGNLSKYEHCFLYFMCMWKECFSSAYLSEPAVLNDAQQIRASWFIWPNKERRVIWIMPGWLWELSGLGQHRWAEGGSSSRCVPPRWASVTVAPNQPNKSILEAYFHWVLTCKRDQLYFVLFWCEPSVLWEKRGLVRLYYSLIMFA